MCAVLLAQQSAGSLNQSLFDTTRLQNAINACPVGQAVELSASGNNNAFLTQPIRLTAGVTLLLDPEVTLFGSTNYADYNCTTTPDRCTPLINVAANTAPNPGAAIMGYGVIDGQGSSCWTNHINDGIRCPRLLWVGDYQTNASSDNFTLYKVTLQNAGQFNVLAISNGLTVWGAKITDPNDSPNTDGIDPSASSNVTITDSYISDGDDHIAIKAGIGHTSNVTISNNHLYAGHGISVGSETNAGANNILVTDNVIDQNGCVGCSSSNDIRIKSDSSRGGEVKDVLYRNLCIRNANTSTHEFVFDPYYDVTLSGTLYPNFHDIHLENVHMVDAGAVSTFTGYNTSGIVHPLIMTMDNVVLDAYNSNDFTNYVDSNGKVVTHDWTITLGPGPVNAASVIQTNAPTETNVVVTNTISNSSPAYDCAGKFVYLAGELTAKANTVTAGQPVTLTAIVQTIISGAPGPTGTISMLENGTTVASASRSGRLTYVTVPGVSSGTHTYTAHYSGDATYAPLDFGSFTVTAK
jgi:polygalacturonase